MEVEATPDRSLPILDDDVPWTARARRVAPCIDGVEYFARVREALVAARRQVWIVGWELHSEIDLLRGDEADRARREGRWPVRFADLLLAIVEARPELEVRLLVWEGAALFALERQHLPRMKLPWAAHERLRLEWDEDTPLLASQHQKFVVVDDRVAFVGGMDLTQSRWDTHEHRVDEPRRRRPGLLPSHGDPYHDAMLAVDGDAARSLGDWARERWRRATGEEVAPPPEAAEREAPDPWPESLEPLLEDRELRFVLTLPDHAEREPRREVERTYLAALRAAERLVYIETQYLTHEAVVEALEARLTEADGPEVVIVLPYGCPGTVQSIALDTARDDVIDRLRAAAPEERLFVGWPTLAGGDREEPFAHSVYVHAKVLVVDDRVLRIGSANLNRRSMGLDSELDAIVEVDGDDHEARDAIASFRRRSLAILLGVDPGELAEAERERGGVAPAIRALARGQRTLHPFEHRAEEWKRGLAPPLEIADPDRPLTVAEAREVLSFMERERPLTEDARGLANAAIGAARRHRGAVAFAAAAVVGLVAVAWTGGLDAESVRRAVERLNGGALGPVVVAAAFTILATLGFPVTALVGAIGVVLDVALALPVVFGGVAASSWLGHALGSRLADRRAAAATLRRREGTPPASGGLERAAEALRHAVGRARERLEGSGPLTVAVLRNVPIAPFAVFNLACGAAGVRRGAFIAGTLLGMLPGILALVWAGAEVGRGMAEGGGRWPLALGGALLVVVAVGTLARRYVKRAS